MLVIRITVSKDATVTLQWTMLPSHRAPQDYPEHCEENEKVKRNVDFRDLQVTECIIKIAN